MLTGVIFFQFSSCLPYTFHINDLRAEIWRLNIGPCWCFRFKWRWVREAGTPDWVPAVGDSALKTEPAAMCARAFSHIFLIFRCLEIYLCAVLWHGADVPGTLGHWSQVCWLNAAQPLLSVGQRHTLSWGAVSVPDICYSNRKTTKSHILSTSVLKPY